jgi:hypothetical protein
VESDSQLATGLDFIIQFGTIWKQVQVVGSSRAAAERQFGERGLRGGEDVVGHQARPDRIERFEPVEQVGVLGSRDGARESLVKVVMGVDQSRQDDMAGKVKNFVGAGGQPGSGADLFDEPIADKKTAIGDFPLMVVKCGKIGVFDEEAGHDFLPKNRVVRQLIV